MLDTLITSKTRLKLLLKFFVNSNNSGYLRRLESEFKEGSNAIRLELNRFEEAGLLKSSLSGNKKIFTSNENHPMFSSLQSMVRKYIGLDDIVNGVVGKIGDLEKVIVTGRIASGLDSQVVDLILVGNNIDRVYLQKIVVKAEEMINKKISFVVFNSVNLDTYIEKDNKELLVIWNK